MTLARLQQSKRGVSVGFEPSWLPPQRVSGHKSPLPWFSRVLAPLSLLLLGHSLWSSVPPKPHRACSTLHSPHLPVIASSANNDNIALCPGICIVIDFIESCPLLSLWLPRKGLKIVDDLMGYTWFGSSVRSIFRCLILRVNTARKVGRRGTTHPNSKWVT